MNDGVGERIRAWRRRRGGMTQQVLAGLAGLSQAYISDIESGRRPLDKKATQISIANALNVSVTQLLGNATTPEDPSLNRALAYVEPIRAAIIELGVGERRPASRDADTLRTVVRALLEHRNASDYAAAAALLPELLPDVAAHGNDMAAELLDVLGATRTVLKRLGFIDLARDAAQIGVRIAEEYSDPAWLGAARFSLVHSFPIESAALGARITSRTADEIQAETAREAREVYGHLHLSAALGEATARNIGAAHDHLDEAEDVARALGEPEPTGPLSAGMNANWFGPTQVQLWRLAVATEVGDAVAALDIARRVDLQAIPVPVRHVYYHADIARTLAAEQRDQEAMHALARAERAAPQHFRANPVVRNLVETLITRAKRRAVAGEMIQLAHKLGIDVL